MKKRFASFSLLALAILCAVCMAVSVSADALPTPVAPVSVEGLEIIPVTSGIVYVGASEKAESVSPFFDSFDVTGVTVGADTMSFELVLFVSATYPHPLSAVAALMEREPDSVIAVDVDGTNDSLLQDWVSLDLADATRAGDYYVLAVEGEDAPVPYTFYRIRIHLCEGSSFTLTELALLQAESDEPEYRYVSDGEIAGGTVPELIPVEADDAAAARHIPAFRFGILNGGRHAEILPLRRH